MRLPQQHGIPNRLGVLLLALSVAAGGAIAAGQDADDWPDWVDEQERMRARIAQVNEGELAFLRGKPANDVHHHVNRVAISEQSLQDGWVVLEQCHDNLDRVPMAEIMFNPKRLRALDVISSRNIDAAYVEGNTVQLRGVKGDSQVCVRAETQALHIVGDGVFELRNGPFMRRFLDGYYPLHLSMRVDYPVSLALADFTPEAQPGFSVVQRPGRVDVEALFEGQLRTRLRFFAD